MMHDRIGKAQKITKTWGYNGRFKVIEWGDSADPGTESAAGKNCLPVGMI